MKAIVNTRYGTPDVMQLREIEKPVPRENEVLVEVHAASVNAFDWHILQADPFFVRLMGEGMFKPKRQILGADFAGRVEAVGAAVTQLKPGDEVFGDVTAFFNGAFAEYTVVRESAAVIKPKNVTMEEAAATPLAGVTALQGLREHGKIEAGQKVLINGASGGVGTFAVQIAKAFGAEVTAVCSARNVETARQIGADHVIDYSKDDFANSGKKYDLILAVNGNRSLRDFKRALIPTGRMVLIGGTVSQFLKFSLLAPLYSRKGKMEFKGFVASPNQKDLLTLRDLLESGQVKPVIERRYSLAEVPDAVRYVAEGHARAKVVIDMKR